MFQRIPAGQRWVVALLAVVSGVSFAIAAFLVARQAAITRQTTAAAMESARASVRDTARTIDRTLTSVVPVVEQVAADIETGAIGRDQLPERLRAAMRDNPIIETLGVAYEPRAFGDPARLHAPFALRGDREVAAVQLEEAYNYTEFSHSWYGDTLLDGRRWNEPAAIHAARPRLPTYAVPLFPAGANREQAAPLGVVVGGIAEARIAEALNELNLGSAGYSFVFTRTGGLVSHPRRELVRNGVTVFEAAWGTRDAALHSVAIRAVSGESGFADARDETTGQAIWIAYEQIPSLGWTLAAVLFQDDFRPDDDESRHRLFSATMAGIVGSLALLLVVLPYAMDPKGRGILVATPTFGTIILAIGIGLLWVVFDRYPAVADEGRTAVYDNAAAEEVIDDFTEQTGQPPIAADRRIPTGVFIRSIEFDSSTNVSVSGYVWQRFQKGVHDAVPRGVLLVEAQDPEMTEAYRVQTDTEEVIGWNFTATFREHFSYVRYPFDRQEIWVRMRPVDFGSRTALVPDFTSFDVPNPSTLPGVMNDLVLPGWDVVGSFFDYRRQRYSTGFGIDASEEVPELYFNVAVRRQFLGPFIAHLVPVVVTLAMLFGILIISTKTTDSRLEWLGFKAMDVVLGCSALFFVASFQHISLRDQLQSPNVFYFEYFYFTLYVAIMLVSINGIVFASHTGVRLIDHGDNLIPKVAFWPVYLTVLLAITLGVLY